jgi:hypothetical protein
MTRSQCDAPLVYFDVSQQWTCYYIQWNAVLVWGGEFFFAWSNDKGITGMHCMGPPSGKPEQYVHRATPSPLSQKKGFAPGFLWWWGELGFLDTYTSVGQFLNRHPVLDPVCTVRTSWHRYVWELDWEPHMNKNQSWERVSRVFFLVFVFKKRTGSLREPPSSS